MGNKIKTFREKAAITQEELARRAKLSRTYIIQLESGRSKKPSAESLYRIAQALNVKVEDFFTPQEQNEKERSLDDVANLLGWAIKELNKIKLRLRQL